MACASSYLSLKVCAALRGRQGRAVRPVAELLAAAQGNRKLELCLRYVYTPLAPIWAENRGVAWCGEPQSRQAATFRV